MLYCIIHLHLILNIIKIRRCLSITPTDYNETLQKMDYIPGTCLRCGDGALVMPVGGGGVVLRLLAELWRGWSAKRAEAGTPGGGGEGVQNN